MFPNASITNPSAVAGDDATRDAHLSFVYGVLKRLSDRCVSYAVIHGLHEFSSALDSDLDLAIGERPDCALQEVVLEVARERGMCYARSRTS